MRSQSGGEYFGCSEQAGKRRRGVFRASACYKRCPWQQQCFSTRDACCQVRGESLRAALHLQAPKTVAHEGRKNLPCTFGFPCAPYTCSSYRLKAVVQASFLEHADHEPCEHFLARAPAQDLVDVPQPAFPVFRIPSPRTELTFLSAGDR